MPGHLPPRPTRAPRNARVQGERRPQGDSDPSLKVRRGLGGRRASRKPALVVPGRRESWPPTQPGGLALSPPPCSALLTGWAPVWPPGPGGMATAAAREAGVRPPTPFPGPALPPLDRTSVSPPDLAATRASVQGCWGWAVTPRPHWLSGAHRLQRGARRGRQGWREGEYGPLARAGVGGREGHLVGGGGQGPAGGGSGRGCRPPLGRAMHASSVGPGQSEPSALGQGPWTNPPPAWSHVEVP